MFVTPEKKNEKKKSKKAMHWYLILNKDTAFEHTSEWVSEWVYNWDGRNDDGKNKIIIKLKQKQKKNQIGKKR